MKSAKKHVELSVILLLARNMADRIYQPGIGPTRNRSTAEALDATVANPDSICAPLGFKITLTTTLYPVEVADSLEFSVGLSGGNMDLIPMDYLSTTHALISATYQQTRWYFTHFEEDFLATTHDLYSATYIQTRWYYTAAEEDFLSTTHALIDATYRQIVVKVDTGSSGKPYEELQLAIAIHTASRMELV